jgi:two-component system cell cycle response regulator DivK
MTPEGPRATVLIVEDNEDNRIIYRTFFEHHGYVVLEACDGEAGVRTAREQRPDIVLMDISMPVLNGLEATKILKADPATAAIPVVALTAHAMAEDRDLAAEAGCDSYVAKPAEPRQVLAEVQRMLATIQPAPGA